MIYCTSFSLVTTFDVKKTDDGEIKLVKIQDSYSENLPLNSQSESNMISVFEHLFVVAQKSASVRLTELPRGAQVDGVLKQWYLSTGS